MYLLLLGIQQNFSSPCNKTHNRTMWQSTTSSEAINLTSLYCDVLWWINVLEDSCSRVVALWITEDVVYRDLINLPTYLHGFKVENNSEEPGIEVKYRLARHFAFECDKCKEWHHQYCVGFDTPTVDYD